MHGTLAMANRKGRKRKSGYRTPSGQLVRQYVDYRKMAAEQPHRRDLPGRARLSQEATTSLGRLHLFGKIPEAWVLAGYEYARRIGAYRATTSGPRATAGNGHWGGCNPDLCRADMAECECDRRTKAYQELFEVVNKCGRRVERVVNKIVAHDEELGGFELNLLSIGLEALARHLRLAERGGLHGRRF